MNLISIKDLKIETIEKIINSRINNTYVDTLENSKKPIVGLLFLEPSTRTKYSFISAVNSLDWNYIDFTEDTMSTKKGESIRDTLIMCLMYVDILIIRSTDRKIVHVAKHLSEQFDTKKVVINAGNGDDEHPTQALSDYYTMLQYSTRKNIKPKFFYKPPYRSINSLQYLLEKANGYNKNDIALADEINFIYVGRGYSGVINQETTHKYPNAYIMHPLPRNEELDPLLDDYDKSIYFIQATNAIEIRTKLLIYLINY